MSFSLRHLLGIFLLPCLWSSLPAAEPQAKAELLRPQHPRVQEALMRALPHLEKGINAKGGYGVLNFLALCEARRCLGEKRPFLSKDLAGYMKSVSRQVGDNNTYIAGIQAMIMAGYVKDASSDPDQPCTKACLDQLKHISSELRNGLTPHGSWGYTISNPQSGENHSTGQYAILGLAASLQAGIKVDKDLLERAALGFIDSQDGSKVYEGGWHYYPWKFKDARNHATPTMTLAGIASLQILSPHLEGPVRAACSKAIERGLAWVDRNPLQIYSAGNSYLLYCIERAGVFLGTDTLGGKDWYDTGAQAILSMQLENGMLRNPNDMAFQALFLSKGSASLGSYKIEEMSLEDIEVEALVGEWRKLKRSSPSAVEAYASKLSTQRRKVSGRTLREILPFSDGPRERLQALFISYPDSPLPSPASQGRSRSARDPWSALEAWTLAFSQSAPENVESLARDTTQLMKKQPESAPARLHAWLLSDPLASRFTSGSPPKLSREEWGLLVGSAPLTASLVLSKSQEDPLAMELLTEILKRLEEAAPSTSDLLLLHHLRSSNPFPASPGSTSEKAGALWRALRERKDPPELGDRAAILELLSTLPHNPAP